MELANKGSGARPLLSERHFVQHPVGSQHKDDHLLGVGLGLIEWLLEHLGQSLAVLELMAGLGAQTKAMKKANANLRIELAQYKDMESFSQFSSDLDAETRRQLEHGKALMELLKQPLYQPKSDAEQVVLLTLAAHGVLDEIKTGELRQKTSAFVRQFRTDPSGVMDEIQASGKLSPEQVQTILNAWNAFAGGDAHAIH